MTDYGRRIEDLAAQAAADAAAFEPPVDPPAPDAATAYLREGVGPAVAIYAEARTGGELYPFDQTEWGRLEGAMNTYLDLYAACYGVDLDADFSVRAAAELLVDTHDVRDVAEMLTEVPGRRSRA